MSEGGFIIKGHSEEVESHRWRAKKQWKENGGGQPYCLKRAERDSWTMDGMLQYTDSDHCQPGFRQGLISQYISISQACYQAALGQTVCEPDL